MGVTRRQFLAAACTAPAAAQTAAQSPSLASPRPLICLFSQVLIKVEYADLGEILRSLGFEACDLSVSEAGHVRPEMASLDLVRAVESLRGAGVDVPVITTDLTSPQDPGIRDVLGIGSIIQLSLFRPGLWAYPKLDAVARLLQWRRDVAGLASLARSTGMCLSVPNRIGEGPGTAIEEMDLTIRLLEPRAVGYDFDPASAVVSAGPDRWMNALRTALPRLKSVTVRDVEWKTSGGSRETLPCPLGQGIVDWAAFFGVLARAKFAGPISLRVDYKPADDVGAIQSDAAFLRKAVSAAYKDRA